MLTSQNQENLAPKRPWHGFPYYPISVYYKQFFGEKVYKIPVSVPGTCPNREGLNGMQVCNFCDEWGSAAHPENRQLSLQDQINLNRGYVQNRTNAKKYLIYFQSYTFTYSRVVKLKQYMQDAVGLPGVVGVVVGTRPDCISDALLDLLNDFTQKLPVFVEFGIQSFEDKKLQWMRRGHTHKKTEWALKRMQKKCPELNVGIHLILGCPDESDAEIVQAARITNSLPVHNVKLHNLHVLKNTPLEVDFQNGEFAPLEIDEYARRVGLFLQHLSPQIPIHRLTANSSRSDELVAPLWTGDKMRSYQFMLDYLNGKGIYQGQLYNK